MNYLHLHEIRDTLQSYLSKIEKIILPQIRTDLNDDYKRSGVLIFCSIYEQSFVSVNLINEFGINTIPIIIRSILESQIDLSNLANNTNGNYETSLRVKFLEKRKKFYHNYVTKFKGTRTEEQKEIEKKYTSTLQELKSMRTSEAESLSISEKFSLLGLEEIYATHYATLCLDAHNDLSILEKKHLSTSDTFEFKIFNKRDSSFIKANLIVLLSSLYFGICSILIVLSIDENSQINRILTDLKNYSILIKSSEIVY